MKSFCLCFNECEEGKYKRDTMCNPVDFVPSCLLDAWYHLFYLRPLPCPPGTPCLPCTRGQCRPLSPLSLCPHFTMPGWCAALTAATMLCPLSTLSTSVSPHVHRVHLSISSCPLYVSTYLETSHVSASDTRHSLAPRTPAPVLRRPETSR